MPPTRRVSPVAALAMGFPLVLSTPLAHGAEDAADGPQPAAPRLAAEVMAGVWIPRMDGTVRLGGGPLARGFEVGSGLDLDDREAVFQAEIVVRKDDYWQVRLDGFDFSTDASAVYDRSPRSFGNLLFVDGTPFRSSLDLTSFGVEVGADAFHPVDAAATGDANGADLRFAPFIGARWMRVEQDVSTAAGQESVDADWGALYGGLTMRLHYAPAEGAYFGFPFDVVASLGAGPMVGGDGGLLVVLRAGARFEVARNVSILAGFRLFELDAEREDYEFDAGLEGLFLNASVRF